MRGAPTLSEKTRRQKLRSRASWLRCDQREIRVPARVRLRATEVPARVRLRATEVRPVARAGAATIQHRPGRATQGKDGRGAQDPTQLGAQLIANA
jgi:hypothetical protein